MKTIFVFTAALVLGMQLSAQMTIQNGYTATQLGNVLAGSNVTITNASISGGPLQYGTFQYTGTSFPLNSGIVMSTGNIFHCPQPATQFASTQTGGSGNSLLTGIAGAPTYDAVVFQFNFEVQTDLIEFQYIFASEEYNEFVGSSFNDVFAFFISGPGISGQENIALIPNTNVPVTINNVNLDSYWQYFNNNETGTTNFVFDGYTTVLTAKKTGLIPCQTYTLTLAIADAGDAIYDAAVFLQAHSLVQGTVSAQANTFSDNLTALEGCINANFTFQLDSAVSVNTVIPIGIGGTAINGVDYQYIDSVLIIPAGQTSVTLIIDALTDGIAEGVETVELYFTPAPCQPKDTVLLYIDDYQTLEFQTSPTDLSCFQSSDGTIDFTITGGTPPFTVELTDSATDITTIYTNLPITGLNIGTYYVKVLDGYGCWAEDIINGAFFDAGTTFLPDGNGVSYQTSVLLSGFGTNQTLTHPSQIQAICLNMEHSFLGDLRIVLRAPNGTEVILKQQPGGAVTNLGEPVATGPNDSNPLDLTPGIGYDYCFNDNPTYGTMAAEANNYTYTYVSTTGVTLSDKYLPPGTYTSYQPLSNFVGVPLNGLWTIIVTDDIPKNNGYIFNWSISLAADPPDSVVTLSQPSGPSLNSTFVYPDCNLNNGSINITITGNTGPYTYLWSNGATTEDISGIGAGNYTVTITGSDNCNTVKTFSVANTGAVGIDAVVTNQICPGTNSGSINITLIGGTAPFTYNWSNGASTEDISGLATGTYSVQVSDAGNCMGAASFEILSANPLSVAGNIINEQCGNNEGKIDITVYGGIGPYTYQWSNGITTQDLQNLQQGTYVVTITDNNNCTKTSSYNVLNLVGNCIPVCDLDITASNSVNETCGNNQGSISQTVYSTNLPYSIIWNNGSTYKDISGLSSGIYTVTITDAAGCEIIKSYNIQNLTGNLNLTSSIITNETCGNSAGAIDISISGGALPYSYIWSNGYTTQDISGLHQGTYTVTITDGNTCQMIHTFNINNQTGNLSITYGNAMSATCGANNGSIDITVAGGSTPYYYLWSNGMQTQDLLFLAAGSYRCTITDNNGCILISPYYTVENSTGNLSFSYLDTDPEICGNGQGEIQTIVQGGSTPYTYIWSNGATTANLIGLSEGTYSATVTDANGCSIYTGQMQISNLPGTLSLTSINTNNEICGNQTGSIAISIIGGTNPISFLWNNGSTSQNLYNINAGNYNCLVTDANGCSFTLNANVTDEAGSLSIQNIVSFPEHCSDGNGSLSMYISGEVSPVSFLWSNGAITQNITSLNQGYYYVTVSDASGCTTTSYSSVNNITGTLNYNVVAVTNEICGSGNGNIDINITGGDSPISILWSNGQTTEDLYGLSAGIYTCTITDNNNCSLITNQITINNISGGLSIASSNVINEVCSNNNGSISIIVSGGSPPYSYLWSGNYTSQNIYNLSQGIYDVTISDQAGCSFVQQYEVYNSPGNLSAGNIIINDEVCGNNNGSITINPGGGSLPYSFLWSNGATTANLTGLTSGTYTLTLSDANNCIVTTLPIVVANNPGQFSLNSIQVTNESCGSNNGAVHVSLTGAFLPVSYVWNNGSNTANILNLSSGVYSCNATDNHGCVLNYSATVLSDPGNFIVDLLSITPSTCNQTNGSIEVSVSGGTTPYTFVWNNGETSQNLYGLSQGTYTLLAYDDAGCSTSQSYNLSNAGGIPVISSVTTSNEQCGNHTGTITVNVTGGQSPYSYNWSGGSSNPCCNYTLQLSDQFGDGWDGANLNIYLDGSLYGNFTVSSGAFAQYIIPVCEVQTIALQYIPGSFESEHSYTLSAPSGILFNAPAPPIPGYSYSAPVSCSTGISGNSNTISGLSAGIFFVTVTDFGGCSVSSSYNILNDAGNMNLITGTVVNDYCGFSVGSINVSTTGGYAPVTYLWSNGATSQNISGLLYGDYTVTVTDGHNCQIVETVTVLGSPEIIEENVVYTDAYCNGNNGAIDVTYSGGSAPVTYTWSNGTHNEDLTGVLPGNYTVTLNDYYGCTSVFYYTVLNTTNGLAVTASSTDPVCTNSTGSIDLSVTGGFSPYTFYWNNGEISEDISGLSQGVYFATITDDYNCIEIIQVTLSASPGDLAIGSSFIQNEFCNGSDGFIMITTTGGTSPFTYNWNNGSVTEDISGLQAGNYSITITDQNGCIFSNSYILQNDGYFIVSDTLISHASCFDCSDGSINISLSFPGGSSGFMEYTWSNGEVTEDISGLLPGYYTVTIVNTDYSCQTVETYLVEFLTIIAESKSQPAVIVYPNPANGTFYVEYSSVFFAKAEITVFDPSGRKIYEDKQTALNGGRFVVNLGEYSDGIYLIKFTSENVNYHYRLIKNSQTY